MAIAVLLVGLPTLGAGIRMDDHAHLRSAMETTWSVREIASAYTIDIADAHDGWRPSASEGFRLRYVRPLCLVVYKLDRALFGSWSPGYHAVNLLLQGLAVHAVFLLGRLVSDRTDLALLGALGFAWLPGNAVTVPFLATLGELLCVLFSAHAVRLHVVGRREGHRGAHAAALACFAGALLSKEYAVVVPGLLVLADLGLVPDRDRGAVGSPSWPPIALHLGLLAGYLVVRSHLLGAESWPPSSRYFCPPWEEGCISFAAIRTIYGLAATLFLLPSAESPLFLGILDRPATLGILGVALGGLALGIHRHVGWDRRGLVAVSWIALFQLPVAFFAPAPWHVYPASAGLALGVAWWGSRARDRPSTGDRSPWMLRGAAVLLGLFALTSFSTGLALAHSNRGLRAAMDAVSAELAARPAARRVFLLDVRPTEVDLVQGLRRELSGRPLEYHLLSLSPSGAEASVIRQLDAWSFVSEARGRPYFLELDWTARRGAVLERSASVGDYAVAIDRRGPLPGGGESGVLTYRYRFENGLSAETDLFLQRTDRGVRSISFDGRSP